MLKKLQLVAMLVAITFASFAQDWIEVNSGLADGTGIGQISIGMNDGDALWASAINTDGSINDAFTMSTDGGQTWTAGTFNAGSGLSMIFAIDASTCWAVFNTGADQGLYKTTDGGAAWEKKGDAYGGSSFANVIHFFNDNEGFAQGDPIDGYYELYTTADGGESWTRVPEVNIPAPTSGEYGITGNYSAVGNSIWWGTNQGRIYYSSDKGASWGVTLTPFTDQNVVQPLFKDESNGICFRSYLDMGIEPELNVTSDGGETWTSLLVNGSMYARWFAFIPGTPGTYLGSTSEPGFEGAAYSEDDGANWTDLTTAMPIQAPVFVDNATGWAGTWVTGGTGGILLYNGEPLPGGGPELVEGFEAYNANDQLVAQAVGMGIDYWDTWSSSPGSGEDPYVTDEIALSGSNSVLIEDGNDCVLLFGNKTSGAYRVEFSILVPTGFYGYFNILQDFAGTASQWGTQAYFDAGGIGTIDAGAAAAGVFNFNYDEWINVIVDIDLTADWSTIYVNGDEIIAWQWSTGTFGTGTLNQLGAMNLWGWNENGTPKSYFDDISLTQTAGPGGDPIIGVTPGSIDFTIAHPGSDTQDMDIANTGNADLEYSVTVVYDETGEGLSNPVIIEGDLVETFGQEAVVHSTNPGNTDAITCPAGAIVSQAAAAFGSAYTADEEAGYSAYQSFTGGGYIDGMRFWVIDFFNDGTTWLGCDGGDPRTFNIGFYSDNGGMPGMEISMQQIEASRVNTGELFSGEPIYEYTIDLDYPVLVTEGWFSVQGTGTTSDCWTLLVNEVGGAGTCMQFNGGSFSLQTEPLGFCLMGEGFNPWLSFDPTAGTVTPGNSGTIEVECNTSALPTPAGTEMYYATIYVNSNDPATPVVEVDVTLELTGGSQLDPPTDLEYEIIDDDVNLTWTSPGGGGGTIEELIYDNGTATGGYSWEGYTMASQMSPAGPCKVLTMKIYTTIQAGDNDFNATIFGWDGSQPGLDIIYEENVIAVDEDWVEVDISGQNITFDGDFTVGFGSVNAATFVGYDAGLNNGRSWDFDNANPSWASWSEAYLIRAIVEYPDGRVAEISSGGEVAEIKSGTTPIMKSVHPTDYSNVVTVKPIDNLSPMSRDLLGFNVYRNTVQINTSLVTGTEYLDENLWGGTYNYYVTAVYDEGESGPSNTVQVIIVGVEELEKNIKIYPNPANGFVNIQSDVMLKSVMLVSYTGQVVYTSGATDSQLAINTSNIPAGVYFLQLETEEGMINQKLIVQ